MLITINNITIIIIYLFSQADIILSHSMFEYLSCLECLLLVACWDVEFSLTVRFEQ